jgi:hypothetical protein
MKTVERERARTLRAQGESVKDIARALSVAPSSVSRWVRDIELTPEQRCLLLANDRGNRLGVARHNRQRARNARKASQEEGRRRARQRDPVHMAGCMLYWAEGSRSRNSVCFRSPTARGEVLVVLHAGPAAAPRPADRIECAHKHTALDGHAGSIRRAAEVGTARPVRRRSG